MKLEWTLLPQIGLRRVVEVMTYGKKTKGRDTWKNFSIEEHLDAAGRHINHYLEGEIINTQDWGLNHLDHAACRLLMAAHLLRARQEREAQEACQSLSPIDWLDHLK